MAVGDGALVPHAGATGPPDDPGQPAIASEDAAVLAEITAQLHRPASLVATLVILAVSLVAFLGAGALQWDLQVLGLVVVVLVLHELGHFAAMRLSGYRNVRMFFIPFFGAGVSGRHLTVRGWTKVVVSLSGPLPGIVLGAVMAVVAIYTQAPLAAHLALLLLWLNGVNLLPVLPLDGGWVVHTLLFSRNPYLDVLFRLCAIVAVLAYGMTGGGRILIAVGALMAIGLPVAVILARITAQARREGLAAQVTDDQEIPPALALAIIAKLRVAIPRTVATRLLAQHTISIVESLNGRPPGWAVTLLLLLIQGVGMMAALFFGVLLSAQMRHF